MGGEPLEDVQEKSDQVHVAIVALTESAPPGLVAL